MTIREQFWYKRTFVFDTRGHPQTMISLVVVWWLGEWEGLGYALVD